MPSAITHAALQTELSSAQPPLVIDVRRQPAYLAASETLRGALRRDPESVAQWAGELARGARAVVYCAHGREVSQRAADELARRGIEARYLEGGIEAGWKALGGALDAKPAGASTRWVTRARPKIDRIACPWLIARFIDPGAEFLYVPPGEVLAVAQARGAVPFDVPDVPLSHDGERCSFDAFLARYHLADPALAKLATIVRAADTDELGLAPEAPGLLAVSLGLAGLFTDDLALLRQGMVVYDALYAWCRGETERGHTWNPEAYRAAARG
jgi:rhodanese-related sulfurtransferase